MIRDNPRYEELRAVVQQNPSLLPQMLEALAQSNPELVRAITENQEEFLQMLQGGDGDGDDDGDGHDHGEGEGVAIQVTPEDESAVERLAALGFSQEQALEAYLACDRKEEVAANFLFDSME